MARRRGELLPATGGQRTAQEELRQALSLSANDNGIDNPATIRLKRKLADEFRRQLMLGAPSNRLLRK
jgi:hypothetical protein